MASVEFHTNVNSCYSNHIKLGVSNGLLPLYIDSSYSVDFLNLAVDDLCIDTK